MKCCLRYLSVLCCLVLLFGSFSIVASAETVENYHAYMAASFAGGTNMGSVTVKPFDTENQVKSWTGNPTGDWVRPYAYLEVTFAKTDKTAFVTRDKKGSVRIENIYWSVPAYYDPIFSLDSVYFIDGSGEYYQMSGDARLTKKDNTTFDISFDFDEEATPFDVVKISFAIRADINAVFNSGDDFYTIFGEPQNSNAADYKMTLDIDTKEVGLLKSLISWVSDIWGGIQQTIQIITELPGQLWNLIDDGLKSLFVPDEEYLASYKDKWDELLARKFGAVYEVANITFDSWDKISNSDETNTINLPNVSIPVSNGETFEFGGYDVVIVPSGFDWLVTMIKALTGGLCTILFVNGLRRRYDEIMGVEK